MKLIVKKDQESILTDGKNRFQLVYIPIYNWGDDEAVVSYVLPDQDPANDIPINDVVPIEYK